MLKLQQLGKRYGKKVVLDDIQLELNDQVGVYGLLGRNGVGKTTMMKILTNMISRYDGQVDASIPLENIVYVTSYISNQSSIFQGKISRLIRYYDCMYPHFDKEYAEKLLAAFQLNRKDKIQKLSTGNKTLVYNILGLATREKVTIFDEPTNGLDSLNRQKFFEYLMEDYAAYPRMFILSTHLIQEVESYLTHVIILKESKVLLDDDISAIQNKAVCLVNASLSNKRELHRTQIGSMTQTYLFDTLSEDDITDVINQGGQIEYYHLQTLFNYLVE